MAKYLADLPKYFYISASTIAGLSFGYHNVRNGNLYDRGRFKWTNKAVLTTVGLAKGIVYGTTWPVSVPFQILKIDKYSMVCPLYNFNGYYQFYNTSKDVNIPNWS